MFVFVTKSHCILHWPSSHCVVNDLELLILLLPHSNHRIIGMYQWAQLMVSGGRCWRRRQGFVCAKRALYHLSTISSFKLTTKWRRNAVIWPLPTHLCSPSQVPISTATSCLYWICRLCFSRSFFPFNKKLCVCDLCTYVYVYTRVCIHVCICGFLNRCSFFEVGSLNELGVHRLALLANELQRSACLCPPSFGVGLLMYVAMPTFSWV